MDHDNIYTNEDTSLKFREPEFICGIPTKIPTQLSKKEIHQQRKADEFYRKLEKYGHPVYHPEERHVIPMIFMGLVIAVLSFVVVYFIKKEWRQDIVVESIYSGEE